MAVEPTKLATALAATATSTPPSCRATARVAADANIGNMLPPPPALPVALLRALAVVAAATSDARAMSTLMMTDAGATLTVTALVETLAAFAITAAIDETTVGVKSSTEPSAVNDAVTTA